ncbi:ribosome maturation factor RimM [Bacillus sp. FJAT-42376]|uniref:ribosome maturation factor RimM n=1 Tax=Bacillus sp. FJAT-42376 TaxID=2014076 RepID=UPI000F4D2DA9|nr:ribosome maturation factor RimM [Bacillus sp. FJAT-42376]AZB42917.1 ribosome maturation factor RimM [Bacillus sp. FJAT-42376]
METKWFNVGKIVNTHGIRGEVRVVSVTDFPEERYQAGKKIFIFGEKDTAPKEVVEIESHRKHKNFDLLTFKGYPNINDVEPFKGMVIRIPESELTELDEHEFYFHEIIGCTVFTDDGKEIGKVREILTPGANDVWVIKRPRRKDALIPYIKEVVKEIDPTNKKIVITPMEGLIDDED